jgi:hypothetical protein
MIPQEEEVCKKPTSSKEVETTQKTSKSPENREIPCDPLCCRGRQGKARIHCEKTILQLG